MGLAGRLSALFVVVAHVGVAGVPCAPDVGALGGAGPVKMTRAEAEALLQLVTDGSGAPHAHAEARSASHGGHHSEHHSEHHADRHAGHHSRHHGGAPAVASTPPPCHAREGASEASARTPSGDVDAMRFLVPACPCGCDQRSPMGGASTVRVGSGVPPAPLTERPAALAFVPFEAQVPSPPAVPAALPDPVPRPASIV